MFTPPAEIDPERRHPKRMRLGTRSCTECRRRKVRCIFAANSKTCKECIAHDTQCIPQQRQGPSLNVGGTVHRKLEELEGIVRRLCNAVDIDIESSSFAEFERNATQALGRLRPAALPPSAMAEAYQMPTTSSSESKMLYSPNSSVDDYENVPLLALFQEVMSLQRSDVQDDDKFLFQNPAYMGQNVESCIKALTMLTPTAEDLTVILKASQKQGGVWSAFPEEMKIGCTSSKTDCVVAAKEYILSSFQSSDSAVIARAALCLALCLQQLPGDFEFGHLNLLASSKILQHSYLAGAETLLSLDEGTAMTVAGLDSLLIQAKLYINMGRPRKAWQVFHRAIGFAMLLGIYHPESDIGARERGLWQEIWQGERQLALILGFPLAVTDFYTIRIGNSEAQSAAAELMYRLCLIAGRIINRNQNHRRVSYTTTVQIDYDLSQCKKEIPLGWWEAKSGPNMPPEEVYGLFVMQIYYHHHRKLLHLPYMLKSFFNPGFTYSKIATLKASRDMIRCYQILRVEKALVMCDLLEYQVFTAAITLVIHLLNCSKSMQRDNAQETRDWEIVHGVTEDLKNISHSMATECTVASQAAEILDYFIRAYQGNLRSQVHGYEAVIPYFGRVKISHIQGVPLQSAPADIILGDPQQRTQGLFSSTIEFSANPFNTLNNGASMLPGAFPSDEELRIDWTSIVDNNITYDWNWAFNSGEPSESLM